MAGVAISRDPRGRVPRRRRRIKYEFQVRRIGRVDQTGSFRNWATWIGAATTLALRDQEALIESSVINRWTNHPYYIRGWLSNGMLYDRWTDRIVCPTVVQRFVQRYHLYENTCFTRDRVFGLSNGCPTVLRVLDRKSVGQTKIVVQRFVQRCQIYLTLMIMSFRRLSNGSPLGSVDCRLQPVAELGRAV